MTPTCLAALLLAPWGAFAADEAQQDSAAAFQSTYVWQRQPAFAAPYSGPHSFDAAREKGYSFSATAFFGWRLGTATELYADVEAVQGEPLSHSQGLGALTNAEAQKSAGSNPVLYRARTFVRHTWGFGGERVAVESDKNQLAGGADANRIVLTAGSFSVTDVFDRSNYSGDPRTQFLNLAFTTHGAFDYPADTRGYTWGAVLEGYRGDWQFRAGRFQVPEQPNGPSLDNSVFRHFGDVAEAVHTHRIGALDGSVRVLAFRDRAVMARFDDALALAVRRGGAPSLDAVRTGVQTKTGWGIALDQAIAEGAGVFARAARSSGQQEVYAFAEIDRSVSLGALMHGGAWSRGKDTVGFAVARNGLSASHRAYLAAGGLGYFVGDGRLDYAPEQVAELFYSAALGEHLWLTGDWQAIRHPGYNADRGPVHVFSARLHTEF
ncbi:MAG TPA: carbohydrate porin [Ramlibacter sp.]